MRRAGLPRHAGLRSGRAALLTCHLADGEPASSPLRTTPCPADQAGSAASVLVAQLGARRHYAVPRALWRSGLLHRLVTDFSADIGPWPVVKALLPDARLPHRLRRLLQRSAQEIPPARIVSLSGIALDPRLRRRRDEPVTDFWARRNAAFGETVVEAGLEGADAVYAFNGAALEIFRAAKADGRRTILDQTAAPWRWNSAILREESERWPGWEAVPSEIDWGGRLTAREEAEWALADAIIVGSDFARSALAEAGGPAVRAVTLPYPFAMGRGAKARLYPGRVSTDRKLRVLFLGTLQLRKGIQYLDEAARSLRRAPIEFRLVGPSLLSDKAEQRLSELVDMRGAAARRDVAAHLAWADVLVLPTLSEGSANVCYEAVAAGVSVVTTPNAGIVLEDGRSARIVPARSSDGIAAALLELAREPELLPVLAAGACAALEKRSFDDYAAELAAIVQGSPHALAASRRLATG